MLNPVRFGIDTVAVRGPASAIRERTTGQRLRRSINRSTGEFQESVTSERVDLGYDAALNVELWREPRGEVGMEFSVPTTLRGDNRKPATPQEVADAVEAAHSDAKAAVTWRCSAEELTVTRLDLARDFHDIQDPGMLIDHLAHVPASRMKTLAYMAKDGRGAETLLRITERHQSRLYDRAAMYAAKTPAARTNRDSPQALATAEDGVVRYELQLRRKEAAKNGIAVVAHLADASLFEICRRYFAQRCRFDTAVEGAAWKIQKAVTDAHADGQKMTAALGQLLLDHHGLEPDTGPSTVMKYRNLNDRYGLAPRDLLHPDRPSVRLDFDLGTVVHVPGSTSTP